MESPYKRPRLLRRTETVSSNYRLFENAGLSTTPTAIGEDSLESLPIEVDHSQKELNMESPQSTPAPAPRLFRRLVEVPVATAVSSILDIVVVAPGTTLAVVTMSAVPTGDTVISIPSVGQVTVTHAPIATQTAPAPVVNVAAPSPSSQVVLSLPVSTPLPSPLPSPSTRSLPTTTSPAASSYFSTPAGESVTGGSLTASSSTYIPASNLLTGSLAPTAVPTSGTAGNSTLTGIGSANGSPTTVSGFSNSTITGADSQSTGSQTGTGFVTLTTDASGIHTITEGVPSQTGLGGLVVTGIDSTPTNGVMGAGGVTATGGSGSSPSSTATGATGTGGGSGLTPQQTSAVAGGVVGGVAGVTIFLLLILMLVRWRRSRMSAHSRLLGESETVPPGTANSGRAMLQTSTVGASFIPFMKKLRPQSGQTNATADTASSTERGFQNLGGRKLDSVLLTGGDGYGGAGPSAKDGDQNLSNTSFLRDSVASVDEPHRSISTSMQVGPGSPTPPSTKSHGNMGATVFGSSNSGAGSPGASRNSTNSMGETDKEVIFMRPGPARMTMHSPGFTGSPNWNLTPPPVRPDPLGRSHPSADNSRGSSKFTENLGHWPVAK